MRGDEMTEEERQVPAELEALEDYEAPRVDVLGSVPALTQTIMNSVEI